MASGLSAGVVNTLQSARAGSTRRQYDSKWRQFEGWCRRQVPQVDPDRAPAETVLSFLQSILEQGRCYSTLKGLVAAISACREGLDLAPVAEHRLVKDFLKAAKRRSSTARSLVPSWDLAVVLDALSGPPFEPIESLDLKLLSLKTLFLVAITTSKRVSDLRALSISERCFSMDPEGRRVLLQPDLSFVTKTQVVAGRPVELPAFHPPPFASPEDRRLNCVCPVRALRQYVRKTAVIRGSVSQLFVTHGPGKAAGKPAASPTLSRWILDAIRLAYSSKGLDVPDGLRAHSTRAMASSWAVAKGVSIQEVCLAANWSSSATFATFYRLDVSASSMAHAVLEVGDPSFQALDLTSRGGSV